jgi:hypothetical protein
VAGQEAVAAPGTAHDWWNAGEDEAQVLIELTPLDPRFELMIGNMFGLANAGKTNAKGMPGLLQLALIGREFQDVMRFTKPPRAVQTVMFGLLGPSAGCAAIAGSIPSTPTSTATPRPTRRCWRSPGWHHQTIPMQTPEPDWQQPPITPRNGSIHFGPPGLPPPVDHRNRERLWAHRFRHRQILPGPVVSSSLIPRASAV